MSARVFIKDTLVGELKPNLANGDVSFEFDVEYASSPARPILGRWFEDYQIEQPRTFRGAPLPKFFRNLLPEGALRKIVEKRLGNHFIPEYAMLLRLGENLPGAVRVVSDDLDLGPLEDSERNGRDATDPFRFALSGMQPKLALSQDDDRLTVPLEGTNGYWIAKLGSRAYQQLVENEQVMLDWAGECGLNVPEHRLILASDIDNFPADFERGQRVLIVRRFDREEDGRRIHQEDFAQIFDVPPEERYTAQVADLGWIHYGSIGAVVRALCGEDDYREYMRRLVFMVLSGNADAHLKNWAFTYPDGLNARLAPVYDFISTVVYQQHDQCSSLRWHEPTMPTLAPAKRLADVTIEDLLAAASCCDGAATSEFAEELLDYTAKVREVWPSVALNAPDIIRERVTAHLRVALLK